MNRKMSERFEELRKKAEKYLEKFPPKEKNDGMDDIKELVEELNIYHAELEIQNQELIQAYERLGEEKDRYLTLFEYAPNGYFMVNDMGLILDTNFTSAVMLDIQRKYIVDSLFYRFISEDWKPRFYRFMKDLRERGKRQSCRLKLMKNGGEEFFVRLDGVPIQDDQFGGRQFLVTMIDITDQIKAEEEREKALQEKVRQKKEVERLKQRFQLLSEVTASGILILDEKGIKFANPACELISGYSCSEIMSMRPDQFVPEKDKSEIVKKIKSLIKKSNEFQTCEMEIVSRSGEIKFVEISVNWYLDGKDPSLLCTLVDVTKRKEMESDLENRLENRTTELMEILRILEYEIRERALADENLDKKQNEFLRISDKLREVETAFSVLLEKREKDREDMEENVVANLKQFVFPEIEKLKQKLSGDKKQSLDAIEQMLNRVISPFSKKLSSPLYSLTGKEIKIANLVKEGKSNEEIADELNIATKTVEYHRNNIRKKLGIKNKKVNLQSHLLSLS